MGVVELLILAVGLSMDAFAVSVCKGLAMKKAGAKEICIVGCWFGGFQALMPLIGYLLGTAFEQYITSFDHWIAFALLTLIGANMLREAFSNDEEESAGASLSFGTMLVLALATSIDALAVGITLTFLVESIGYLIFAVLSIGIITFILSAIGVRVGNLFGVKYKKGAVISGGVILILLGVKILLEHLGVINF